MRACVWADPDTADHVRLWPTTAISPAIQPPKTDKTYFWRNSYRLKSLNSHLDSIV